MIKECIGCGADTVKKLIDLGSQPPSNLYLLETRESYDTHPIEFCICISCGLAQLSNPMPPDEVRSRFDWISYNEPEGHLDNLVEILATKIDLSKKTHIVGVTYKDDSTLDRFYRKGIVDTYRLNQTDDLQITEPLSSEEGGSGKALPKTTVKLKCVNRRSIPTPMIIHRNSSTGTREP